MKDTILESSFFWTAGTRSKIMMTVIPVLLCNSTFLERIDSSAICSTPWDSNEKNRPLKVNLSDRFQVLLDKCNSYRSVLGPKVSEFDTDNKIDLVKFAYAAYTHQKELHVIYTIVCS